MLREKMVISTRGSLVISWNREGSPREVKITPKVEGRAAQASVKLTELPASGDAHGDSQQGCKDDADEDSARTRQTSRMTVSTSPIRNSQKEGRFRAGMAGMPDSKLIISTFRRPI